MSDTTDNRGPNMKHIMDDIQNTLCHDMMSWDELADRCLELETELQTANGCIKVLTEALKLRAQSYDANSKGWQKDIKQLKKHIKALAEALKLAQFGFNHRRCPVCAGWNMSENGETDMIHRKDCKISIALAAVKEK